MFINYIQKIIFDVKNLIYNSTNIIIKYEMDKKT